MGRVNKAKGNMYSWVTHTWSPMVGCPHQCSYCYVRTYRDLPVEPLIELIIRTGATFVNIGADSKGHGLPEPSAGKVVRLVKTLEERKIKILRKQNLGRIWGSLYSPK